MRRRLRAAAVMAAIVVVSALLVPAASAQTVKDIEARDSLVAAQEALLNVYRCRFGIDTEIVPWGCFNGVPVPEGQAHLYDPVRGPIHAASFWWLWRDDQQRFRELTTEFTIHNDVGDWSDEHGYYLMLAFSEISGANFYFGLQTDANGRGKGVIFSRWDERDLANARWSKTDGWTESSGHEGDFIGVRRFYPWSAGNYRIRIGPDGLDSDGEWFGLWITDLATNATTWIGSLKFPLLNGVAAIQPSSYATIELYGGSQPILPIDIPQWYVSVERPWGDGVQSTRGINHYPWDDEEYALFNSDVWYDPSEDAAHLLVGGTTERKTAAGQIDFPTG